MAEILYKDIDLNFLPHPVSGDLITITDGDAIKQSVRNLILTKYGERRFRPELGSPIPGILFRNAGPFTAQLLQKGIEETLINFEPRITVNRINITGSIKTNSFFVEIIYTIMNSTSLQTLNLTLERTR